MINTIARETMGGTIPAGSISFTNLLDEDSLERIAESVGKRVWKEFITFDSASVGILAIFIIIRMAKLVIYIIIHSYALGLRLEHAPTGSYMEFRHAPAAAPRRTTKGRHHPTGRDSQNSPFVIRRSTHRLRPPK